MKQKTNLLIVVIALVAGALGVVAQRWQRGNAVDELNAELADPTPEASVVRAGERRPEFSLADLSGQTRSISEWNGRVVLINFWATWCAPCRKEMPELAEVHDAFSEQGFSVLGIAIDMRDPVVAFVAELGVDYPMLIGELDAMDIARRFGNRLGVLPYTVILDREGRVVLVHAGEIDRATVEAVVLPLLAG